MSDLRNLEQVTVGDTARETVIRLTARGRKLPVEPTSAVLVIEKSPADVERALTHMEGDDWYFRWTTADFTALPASATNYQAQVRVTFEDGSKAYFPTGAARLQIKVTSPI